MTRRFFLALALVSLLAACGGGQEPFDSVLPHNHQGFTVKAANLTVHDLYVDVYLDDHYYPAGLVPAPSAYTVLPSGHLSIPSGATVYFTVVNGPYDWMPHRVIVNGRLPSAPSLSFKYSQFFYYGKDYGLATPALIVVIQEPPPPPPGG